MNRRSLCASLPFLFACLCAASTSAQTLQSVPASPFIGPTADKPGYGPPQSSYRPFDTSADLAFQGGQAKPAVAKDCLPGYPAIHDPAYANDGNYGNGASWISDSPNSWLKVDLGQVCTIDSILLGRDRLGGYDDRDPGQFTVAVATTDNIYANGDDSNDDAEYVQVFDSSVLGFSGDVNGPETLEATFAAPVSGQFVKVTFQNAGIDIDELEVHGAASTVPEPGSLALLATIVAPGTTLLKRRKTA